MKRQYRGWNADIKKTNKWNKIYNIECGKK